MLVLALDTALAATQIALLDGAHGTILASRSLPMATGHAEILVPAIEECLAEAGCDYTTLQRIAVTIGPGSFTGVRIALATARALGLALHLPVIGVTTLEALAYPHLHRASPVLAALDARRDEIYAALFSPDGETLLPPSLTSVAEFAARLPAAPLLAVGSAAALLAETSRLITVAAPSPLPPIDAVARIAAGRTPADHPPSPLYLRAPDAKPQTASLARTP